MTEQQKTKWILKCTKIIDEFFCLQSVDFWACDRMTKARKNQVNATVYSSFWMVRGRMLDLVNKESVSQQCSFNTNHVEAIFFHYFGKSRSFVFIFTHRILDLLFCLPLHNVFCLFYSRFSLFSPFLFFQIFFFLRFIIIWSYFVSYT